ncbi:MAG: hypothetical protein WD824_13535 [Cyclobacteriaceae bacterium]
MELLLKLNRMHGNALPVNYQYPLSSWIYKVISQADEEYSVFLHEKGFAFESRKFKMFTFSQLNLRPYEISGNEIRLLGKEASLIVRFLVDSSLEHFIKGLFMDQHFGLGDRNNQVDFQVSAVETKAPPRFEQTMRYQCLSPIVTSTRRDDGTVAYLLLKSRGMRGYLFRTCSVNKAPLPYIMAKLKYRKKLIFHFHSGC